VPAEAAAKAGTTILHLRMHIVHVASGRLFGGIEQMLLTLSAHESAAPDLRASFAIAAPGRLEDTLRAGGADVVSLGDVRLRRPATIVQARAILADALRRTEPRAVVCHAPWSFALFAGVVRRHGVPLVLWLHERAGGRSLVELWARRTRADLVISNSAWTSVAADLLQPGVPRVVIHPPVALAVCPPGTRDEVRAELGASPSSFVILGVSRMEPLKGHLNVLRALAPLAETPSWEYWIAGGAQRPHERDYVAQLEGEADVLGLRARVRFLGERRDVPRLLAAADVFCQMNETPEAFGVVFAEALLARVPVVTADLGGAPEIVSSACGILVAPGDRSGLSNALVTLRQNPALRSRLGDAGPAHAAGRCAPGVVLPQLARALDGLERNAAA
jgi:glycosyltransferase involved in cell wall biosynthesis